MVNYRFVPYNPSTEYRLYLSIYFDFDRFLVVEGKSNIRWYHFSDNIFFSNSLFGSYLQTENNEMVGVDPVKKVSIIGISILAAGGLFLIMMGIEYAESVRVEEYLKIQCSRPGIGNSCPLLDPYGLLPVGSVGLVLVLLGTYILAASKTSKN